MSIHQRSVTNALLNHQIEHPDGLTDGAQHPAGRRFDVYRNNLAVSLTEALEVAFPILRKLVGTRNFKLLAAAYFRKHPPHSPLMMFYGAKMPEFLTVFEPTTGTAYLPDIARLELALRQSYHAADAKSVDPALIQSIPSDALIKARLRLAPSVQLVASEWPILAIWRFHMEDEPHKPEMKPENVVVLRPEMDPAPHLLPPGGAEALTALLSGDPLGKAMDAGTQHTDDFDLAELLTPLMASGSITMIEG